MLGYKGLGHLNANLFRREQLLEMNGFDGDYPSCDDFELFFRYLKGGYAFVEDLVPGAEHIHHAGPRITNTRLADMARQRMMLTGRVVAFLRMVHQGYYDDNLPTINAFVLRAIRQRVTVDMPGAMNSMHDFFPEGYRSYRFDLSVLPSFALLYPVLGFFNVERLRIFVTRFLPDVFRRRLK